MIRVGTKAPEFTCDAVVDGSIKKVSLRDFGDKYKLIFFYPLDFTYVCPTELHALQDNIHAFDNRNVQVLGCSIDSPYCHMAWLQTPKSRGGIEGVQYPLLADVTKTIAKDYGVLHEDGGVALRGVFLLDKNNVVQYASVHNLALGRNIKELLRVVDALSHVENNGEVCPANWVVGSKAMKADQDGLKDYFN